MHSVVRVAVSRAAAGAGNLHITATRGNQRTAAADGYAVIVGADRSKAAATDEGHIAGPGTEHVRAGDFDSLETERGRNGLLIGGQAQIAVDRRDAGTGGKLNVLRTGDVHRAGAGRRQIRGRGGEQHGAASGS